MHLSERQVDGVSIIDISGDAIQPAENPTALRERVVALILRSERRILLNLANLQHMDSSCLGEIVESFKTAASNGAVLKLAHVSPHLQNLLRTTALDKILETYETENEAIASFGKTPPAEPMRTVLSTGSLWVDE
jgi:anti-sigma B factor antagonist